MNAEDELYRDLWIAEMWKPVREYLAPIDPRAQVVKKAVEKRRKNAA